MTFGFAHADLYHTGIVVADVEAAKTEFSALLGITWGIGGHHDMPILCPDGPRTVPFEMCYSSEGPHRLELVAPIPGTLWANITAPGGAHHIGYWCDDIAGSCSRVRSTRGAVGSAGRARRLEEDPFIAVLHRLPSGLYVELVDRAARAVMFPDD